MLDVDSSCEDVMLTIYNDVGDKLMNIYIF